MSIFGKYPKKKKIITPLDEIIIFMTQRIQDSNKIHEQRALSGMITVIKDIYLEKEKQAIIDAYNEGINYYEHDNPGLIGEEYFNKTFES